MYAHRSRLFKLKRKKVERRCRQLFHARCFQRFRDTKAIHIIACQKSLDPLDLAVGLSTWKRKWVNVTRHRIIRCLPPNCAEYLLPDVIFPKKSALGEEFQKMADYIGMQLDVLLQTHQHFVKNLYVSLEKQIVSHDNCNRFQLLQIVCNYLKLVEIIKPFQMNIGKFHFNELFTSLVKTVCNELAGVSSLDAPMGLFIKSACNDEDSKMSVFIFITELGSLEYVLNVARRTRFDFWGLWRGEGDLSKSFNPVAVYIGYYRRLELARTLLKYGFQYAVTEDVFEDRCYTLVFQSYHDIPIITKKHADVLVKTRGERMLLILEIFLTFLNCERNLEFSESLFTLIYIARSLPYPYITSTELFRCFKYIVHPTFIKRLIEICKKYTTEEIYDDDYKEYKPRKLVHLCRCVIRKALTNNLKLPDGVYELKISLKLKEYLLLER